MMARVALVAGGTGDIGQAICRELARMGMRVAVGYAKARERADTLAAELGGMAVTLRAEDENAPAEAIRTVRDHFGRLDVLANAVGINLEGSAPGMRREDWQNVMEVNLGFAFRLTQAAMPYMLPQKYGRIVHLSSIAGRTGGRGQINYAAAKAGLERMVRVFALEVSRKGVTVNCVAPGVILSAMSQRVCGSYENELLDRIACRRFGTPEDVAKAVAFLVGEGACYITGAVLPVDGGMLL
ncbi:MAG: SDR family oxidoreductase [Clostridiales Family XIII bacterium]|jgi:NAD(P)-dependent dehydrogenase (short-subunit alcohol dehydrogenase family)|nr:SDR family oxidoreductase [Clostridiales Family XIII bacterium]